MNKTNMEIADLFVSNYSAKDLANMLIVRMSKEEIDKELESFEAISSDPGNSELPIQ